jgi:carboxypeptidase family protein/TonB-dependent receptor-like protein
VNQPASLIALLLLSLGTEVNAQIIRGRVLGGESRGQVAGAEIALLDQHGKASRRVLTDTAGAFAISAPRSGTYTVRVKHIAYSPFLSAPITLAWKKVVHVAVTLTDEAISLTPVVVTAREKLSWQMTEFERRRTRLGSGYFITQKQIDERPAYSVSDLLRFVPGVTLHYSALGGKLITMNGGRCVPNVYFNGMIVDSSVDDFLIPEWLGGIEVYPRGALAPVEYSKGNCGVILLWSREFKRGGGRWTAPRIVATAGLLGFAIGLAR